MDRWAHPLDGNDLILTEERRGADCEVVARGEHGLAEERRGAWAEPGRRLDRIWEAVAEHEGGAVRARARHRSELRAAAICVGLEACVEIVPPCHIRHWSASGRATSLFEVTLALERPARFVLVGDLVADAASAADVWCLVERVDTFDTVFAADLQQAAWRSLDESHAVVAGEYAVSFGATAETGSVAARLELAVEEA